MLHETQYYCPECDEGLNLPPAPSRRMFLRAAMGATAIAAAAGASRLSAADEKPKAKPAEALIRELYSGMTPEQKKDLIMPYEHKDGDKLSRHRTFNSAPFDKRLGRDFTKPQREQIEKIVRSLAADGDDAWNRITRGGKWDGSGSFDGTGAMLFGDPAEGQKFAWLFSGHHITLRCDGDSQPGAAWGGPIYYGHSPNGYSTANVFNYQTANVRAVFEALDEKQRAKATGAKSPEETSKPIDPIPGIAYAELTTEQRALVEKVMKALLDPFRAEDATEVMQLVKTHGGMDKLHVAFFKDDAMKDKEPWHFWRVEGPGFVWNYRVLPHVHCFVNIGDA